ncbi:disulfide bond formation protein DsbC [Hydrogenovibrio sp. SC-1]|uniref:DsbC family protein n=1 Tax=Hydrogenovibrio sp. SC-1 TaxID=2065820 RepID=UPI000C7CA2F0|nr:DsbC family protein [Hydrogenovibrio sp. SC-1]PLA75595.1 disulfide bond formation protein DsbC [Hydrogenovibrio sp. SC-1]
MTLLQRLPSALFVVALTSGLWSGSTLAQEVNSIQARLNELIPGAPEAMIKPTPIAGLYQVTIDTKVVYMSENGQYLVSGSIIDLETRENLTELAGNIARKKALSQLDNSEMLIYPAKGKALRSITVFTDIDCPYCQKLHKEIPALNAAGIEVRYLAYPRAGVGSESFHKTVSVWCSKDQALAMDQAMTGKAISAKQCDNPVASHLALGQVFEVNGTPNIILDSGERIPGYAPAAELIQVLTPKTANK